MILSAIFDWLHSLILLTNSTTDFNSQNTPTFPKQGTLQKAYKTYFKNRNITKQFSGDREEKIYTYSILFYTIPFFSISKLAKKERFYLCQPTTIPATSEWP